MRRRIKTSITAEVFYLILFSVLVTAGVIGFYLSRTFENYLMESAKDISLTHAERTAAETSQIIDQFTLTAQNFIQKLDESGDLKRNGTFLLKTNSELISVSVFYTVDQTVKQVLAESINLESSASSSQRFEGKSVSQITTKALTAAEESVAIYHRTPNASPLQVQSLVSDVGLPISLITTRFNVEGQPTQKIYVSLGVWQTRLFASILSTKLWHTAIIDQNGSLLISSNAKDLSIKGKNISSELLTIASKKKSPLGFVESYKNGDGSHQFGAYAQVASYPRLYVLLEQSHASLLGIMNKAYYGASLRIALLTLLGLLLSFVAMAPLRKSLHELLVMTRYLAAGKFTMRVQPQTYDEVAELALSMNQMTGNLTDLVSSHVRGVVQSNNLHTAHLLQQRIYPNYERTESPLEISGFYEPHSSYGSNLWGHFKLQDSVELIYIADVIPPSRTSPISQAMAYAVLQSAAISLNESAQIDKGPLAFLNLLNKFLYQLGHGDLGLSVAAAVLDFKNGTIKYVTAGHVAPLFLSNVPEDPRFGSLPSQAGNSTQIFPLSSSSEERPIGLSDSIATTEHTLPLAGADRIVFYSQGYVSATLPMEDLSSNQDQDSTPSTAAITEVLAKFGNQPCIDIKNSLLGLTTSQDGQPTPRWEDITVVTIALDKYWSKPSLSEEESDQPHKAIPRLDVI